MFDIDDRKFSFNPSFDLRYTKNLIKVSYDPDLGQTYVSALSMLYNAVKEIERSGNYVGGIFITAFRKAENAELCLDPKNYDSRTKREEIVVLYSASLKKIVPPGISHKKMLDLLCDLETLPVLPLSSDICKILYSAIPHYLISYRGAYPHDEGLFTEKERPQLAPLLNSLETTASYPKIHKCISKTMEKLAEDEKMEYATNIKFYVLKDMPAFSSISTLKNDVTNDAISELKCSIIYSSVLEDLEKDADIFANVARGIVFKALQINYANAQPPASEINNYLKNNFGFITGYFCPYCFAMLTEDYVHCPECGKKIANDFQQEAIEKSSKKFREYLPQGLQKNQENG